MFYLTYLRRELVRRKGRTILTSLGLGVGVALVVAVASLTAGLDRAQARVLGPLASVGTDLLVTRPVDVSDERITPEERRALVAENQSVLTDLAKLGPPGTPFEHDLFLAATQLTFDASRADAVRKVDGVREVAAGLTLVATHQKGTVPNVVAEFQTGGETLTQTIRPEPMSEPERAAFRECAEAQGGLQPGRRRNPDNRPVYEECLPERFRQAVATFTTPLRTLRQAIGAPQTDIRSEPYTIAGVDTSTSGLAILQPSQVTAGRFLAEAGEAVLAEGYAGRRSLVTGGTLAINGQSFRVVGLAKPAIGGMPADVYLTLGDLQHLSGRDGRVNSLLVRADSVSRVTGVQSAITDAFEGADVTSARELASRVSGSLVNAARLASTLGVLLAALGLGGAFLLAGLLTAASVAKRVRELGTLKAIGWRQRLVVRQVMAESVVQALAGGLAGAALGAALATAIAARAPALTATAAGTGAGVFGLGRAAAPAARVALDAPLSPPTIVLALGLALLGGLAAGGVGAMRVAHLRPADALREI